MEKMDDSYISMRIHPTQNLFITEIIGNFAKSLKRYECKLDDIFVGIDNKVNDTIRFGFHDIKYLKKVLTEFNDDTVNAVLRFDTFSDENHSSKNIATDEYYVGYDLTLSDDHLKIKVSCSSLDLGYKEITTEKLNVYLSMDKLCQFDLMPPQVKTLSNLMKLFNTNEFYSISCDENGVRISDDSDMQMKLSDASFGKNSFNVDKTFLNYLDSESYACTINSNMIILENSDVDGDKTLLITALYS